MGANISRRLEPEVHVVVVQSQENGQVDAKVLRKTYRSSRRKSGLLGALYTCACTTVVFIFIVRTCMYTYTCV